MNKTYKNEKHHLMPFCLSGVLLLFLINLFHPLPGSDDGVEAVIANVAPQYQSWMNPIGLQHELGMEAVLLIAQLLIGLLLLVGFILKYKKASSFF
jgi:ABC-type cobalt transport system substrate-binding protein